jgi:hypothetical protein
LPRRHRACIASVSIMGACALVADVRMVGPVPLVQPGPAGDIRLLLVDLYGQGPLTLSTGVDILRKHSGTSFGVFGKGDARSAPEQPLTSTEEVPT